MGRTKSGWTLSQIQAAQVKTKAALDAIDHRLGHQARLQEINRRLKALDQDTSSFGLLERYTLAMSALVHHMRHKGLTRLQIRRIVELLYAVLALAGIKPRVSRFSYLYGDIHLTLSHIHRRNGRMWEAQWEERLAASFSKNLGLKAKTTATLASGIRALRSGNASLAMKAFSLCQSLDPSQNQREKAVLGEIKSLRLATQFERAEALYQRLKDDLDLSRECLLELEWENLCCKATLESDPYLLSSAFQIKNQFHCEDYPLDALIWCHASSRRQFPKPLPGFSTLVRRLGMTNKKYGLWLKTAMVLDLLQNSEIPFLIRFKEIGKCLAQAHRLVSVDKELLLWAVAARWLYRQNNFLEAQIVLHEYQRLSLSLSQGRSKDVLNTAGDIEEKVGKLSLRRVFLGKTLGHDIKELKILVI